MTSRPCSLGNLIALVRSSLASSKMSRYKIIDAPLRVPSSRPPDQQRREDDSDDEDEEDRSD